MQQCQERTVDGSGRCITLIKTVRIGHPWRRVVLHRSNAFVSYIGQAFVGSFRINGMERNCGLQRLILGIPKKVRIRRISCVYSVAAARKAFLAFSGESVNHLCLDLQRLVLQQ